MSQVRPTAARRPGSTTSSSPETPVATELLYPEPADLVRLGRRLIRLAVSTARADETPNHLPGCSPSTSGQTRRRCRW